MGGVSEGAQRGLAHYGVCGGERALSLSRAKVRLLSFLPLRRALPPTTAPFPNSAFSPHLPSLPP